MADAPPVQVPVSRPEDLDTGQHRVETLTGWDARTARTAVRALLKAGQTLDAAVTVCVRAHGHGLPGAWVPRLVADKAKADAAKVTA